MPLKTLSLEHGANIAVFPNTLTYLEMYADSNCDMEALPETLKYLYLTRTSSQAITHRKYNYKWKDFDIPLRGYTIFASISK